MTVTWLKTPPPRSPIDNVSIAAFRIAPRVRAVPAGREVKLDANQRGCRDAAVGAADVAGDRPAGPDIRSSRERSGHPRARPLEQFGAEGRLFFGISHRDLLRPRGRHRDTRRHQGDQRAHGKAWASESMTEMRADSCNCSGWSFAHLRKMRLQGQPVGEQFLRHRSILVLNEHVQHGQSRT